MRKIKTFGVVAVVALVVSAGLASAVSAASFTLASSPTILTQNEEKNTTTFTVDRGSVTCELTQVPNGTISGTSVSSMTVEIRYFNCNAYTGEVWPAKVTLRGCHYVIYASGATDLVCPSGHQIEIDTAFNVCNVTIKPQAGLAKVAFTTHTSPAGTHGLILHSEVTNLQYEESGVMCAEADPGPTTGGSLISTVTFIGHDEFTGKPVDITHDA